MTQNTELPDFGPNSPICLFYQTFGVTAPHCHPCIELIYISCGQAAVSFRDTAYLLKEDDLLLINPYEIHSIRGDSCAAAFFQLYLNRYDQNVIAGLPLRFDCNSSLSPDKSGFTPIKKLLAQLIKTNMNPLAGTAVLYRSLSYSLLYELISSFGVEDYQTDRETKSERMEDILNYINTHYQENLSLNLLAKRFYLTVPYLSRMFKNSAGINFSEYLSDLRLSFCIRDLIDTDDSIESIAERNGFPNSRSFVTSFREEYGMLPSSYRREKQQAHKPLPLRSAKALSEYLIFEQHNYLGRLAEYLNEPTAPPAPSAGLQKLDISPVNASKKGLTLHHTFKTTTGIGKAKQILLSENQNMLRELQKDVGFTYIKFHGLFDDDMMVYSEKTDGTPELSFTSIDMAFDFLLSIGLKPLMQLSFMPKALAAAPEHTMFFSVSVISLPKDMKKWIYLVEQLILHLETRYGSHEVAGWPFCLWNEPDSPENMFGLGDKDDFFEFYRITYETVKRINSRISFGSPSCMYSTLTKSNWIEAFLDFSRKNNCEPDFFNFHFYPVSLEDNPFSDLPQDTQLVLAESEDILHDTISRIWANLKSLGLKDRRLYLTEWNSSVSHRDLLNDTAFKAAYVVKNILENYDRLDSFGYWLLSDFVEEVKLPGEIYHGGLGLFTCNGIKKAHYYAFVLLARLGDVVLDRGKGYFITKNRDGLQIMLYNYQHYSSLYAAGELFDMKFTKRYTPFVNTKNKRFTIPLTKLEHGSWLITETIVNQEYGSSFDNWVASGALPMETMAETNYLKSISVPRILKRKTLVRDGLMPIQAELMPHEIRLIELKPCHD